MKFLVKLALNAVVVGMVLPMPGLFGMEEMQRESKRKSSSKDNPLLPRNKGALEVYEDGVQAYSKVSAWSFSNNAGALAKKNGLQEIKNTLLPHKSDSSWIAVLLTRLDEDIQEIDKILQGREREEKENEATLAEVKQVADEYEQQKVSKRSSAAAQPKAKETKIEQSGLLATPEISISRPHSWKKNILFASIFAVAAAIGAWFWFSRSKVS